MDLSPRLVRKVENPIVASKAWYLLCYDIRSPGRLRRISKAILGRGERVQYSVFRCRLTKSQLEKLLWEVGRIMEDEDSLMVVGLCGPCVGRIEQMGAHREWPTVDETFDII